MNMRAVVLFVAIIVAGLLLNDVPPDNSTPSPTPPEIAASSTPEISYASSTVSIRAKTYPVVKVVDGDTLDILMDGKAVRLRLIGLDTPETVDPRKVVQCFGREASAKAKDLLTGTSVSLEMDTSQGTLDKYGRTLAYVFLPNSTNFNEYMIAEGYGHEYTYNLPYKYQEAFKAAETKAREEKKGLWADEVCS